MHTQRITEEPMIRPVYLILILSSFLGCQANEVEDSSNKPRVYIHAPEPVVIHRGETAVGIVRLDIREGFHVQANPVPYPYLIPTELKTVGSEVVSMGPPLYPAGKKYTLQGSSDTLLVYEGNLDIHYFITVADTVRLGEYEIEGTVTYQTCDDRMCFPPVEKRIKIPVTVF